MGDSKNSKLFTFGKLENTDDSDSEEPLSDLSDEDAVSNDRGGNISPKTNENNPELAKEVERLDFNHWRAKDPIKSSDAGRLDITDWRAKRPVESPRHDFNDWRAKDSVKSSDASPSASFDCYKKRNYDGSDTDAAQLRPRYGAQPERRNLFGLGRRLRGNWTLRCDDEETDLDGLTESDITWAAVNELYEKEAGILTLRPDKFSSRQGFTSININTPDVRDEEFILKVANLLREHVYFPYVMYYHESASSSSYMHTPNGEFYTKDDKNRWVLRDEE